MLSSVACLARCNGAAVKLRRPLSAAALSGVDTAAAAVRVSNPRLPPALPLTACSVTARQRLESTSLSLSFP